MGLKDNINPQGLLVEPTEIIDDPPPSKPEAVGPGEDAGEANARVLRDQAAVRRVTELYVERRRKSPRISQNWFYHEAEARLKLRLFFALGNDAKRRFADSFPHTDISVTPFREFHNGCETLFKVARDYTVERIKLYNTVFMLDNDTFSSFYARLSAQIALCNWPNAQERETLKDIFIGRIRDVHVQQLLIKIWIIPLNSHWGVKRALGCENPLSSKNYFLTISFSKLLKLNKNPLSQFSRLEENVTILKIKPIDKTRKAITGTSRATSVVILLFRITESLVQLAKLRVISARNVVFLQTVVIHQNDE